MCWMDAVDGCRLVKFSDARSRGDMAFLSTMSKEEAARCQVG